MGDHRLPKRVMSGELNNAGKRGPGGKQPIMRIEDGLFYRGWLRSAMAAIKCGNINFPKYFMAVRPFLMKIFFSRIIWVGGVKKISLKNFVRCTI